MKTTSSHAASPSVKRANFRQVLECGDGACGVTVSSEQETSTENPNGIRAGHNPLGIGVTAFARAGLTLPKLATDNATPIQSGDFADSVAALHDAGALDSIAPRPIAPEFATARCSERGQTGPREPKSRNSQTKLSALLFFAVALTTVSLLLLCPACAHAQGGVPLWTNSYPGRAYAQSIDGAGNVLVTAAVPAVSNLYDYVTIKFSNGGVPLWTNRWLTNGPFFAGMAVEPSGDVLVTEIFGNGVEADLVTIYYSVDGVLLWTNRYHGSQFYLSRPMAVDSGGNVIVARGSYDGSDLHTEMVKYSNSGVPLWTNTYDGLFNDRSFPNAVAVDRVGNVFVTGGSYNPGSYCDTVAYSSEGDLVWLNSYDASGGLGNAITVDSVGNVFVTALSFYYLTIKYSGAGDLLWTNRYSAPASTGDQCRAIVVDGSGDVSVTGYSQNADSSSSTDYLTVGYSSAGLQRWARRYSGPGTLVDQPTAIAVDRVGNVFVTGASYSSINTRDMATLGYSNAGVPLWTKRYHGSGKENEPAAIAVDRTGNVFVTGYAYDGTNFNSVTIKYSSSIPLPRLDFQTLNNQLVLSWTNAGFTLQTAPAVTGTFTNILGATSPFTNVTTSAQQFFRLKGD